MIPIAETRTGRWSPLAALIDRRWIPFLAAIALLGCEVASPPPKPPSVSHPEAGFADRLTLSPTSFGKLIDWAGDDHGPALAAFRKSCAAFSKMPASSPVGEIGGYAADWQYVCKVAIGLGNVADGPAKRFFENWFNPYIAVANNDTQGLFTGYYEAGLKGAWYPHDRYRTPLYALPGDPLVAKKFTRAEIEGGALAGKGLELLWVDDPVDAFFLHIQGSGRVIMEDGQVVHLGFAGKNGRPYVSIGGELVRRGVMARDVISMQRIRGWLKGHPVEGAELMAMNESFVFFRIVAVNTDSGPVGAQGVALTPGRSLAVDRRFIPLGVPLWLDISDPMDKGRALRRLVVAQDSGSAIKGPVRGDLFWGFGEKAARYAGKMKSTGRYYILLPKRL